MASNWLDSWTSGLAVVRMRAMFAAEFFSLGGQLIQYRESRIKQIAGRLSGAVERCIAALVSA